MYKESKWYKIIFALLLIFISILLSYYTFMFKNILSLIIILILVLFDVLLLLKIKRTQLTFTKGVLYCTYILVLMVVKTNIQDMYSKLQSINVSYTISGSSIVKLNGKNINNNKIGVIFDDKEKLKLLTFYNYELVIENSYSDVLKDLYDEEIKYAYLPSNYIQMFNNLEQYESIESDTEVIYTSYEKEKNEDNNIDIINQSFSILLMGVDSSEESSFNGDALMLITFNPKTLNSTILSIPRDTYTNITCFENMRKNKITHAAWYGEKCMISSIENMFDINIDYFVKINFEGFVSLIDQLGGIDINVPISFCEQDSKRNFENEICLDKGLQHINGEQALALTRHRKTINDFIRNDNQKLVLEAIIKKASSDLSIDRLKIILNTISDNIRTNISIDKIIKLYSIISKKNVLDNIKILKLDGHDAYIYDYDFINNVGMDMLLYNFVPYSDSISYLSSTMKNNLNGEEIEDDYDELNIDSVVLIPEFKSILEAKQFCDEYNIELNIEYKEGSVDGVILGQSIPPFTDIEYILPSLTLEVSKKVEKINCLNNEFKKSDKCLIPNFVGKDYNEFKNWLKQNNYSFIVIEHTIHDEENVGKIIKQSIKNGYITDLIGKRLEITYGEK